MSRYFRMPAAAALSTVITAAAVLGTAPQASAQIHTAPASTASAASVPMRTDDGNTPMGWSTKQSTQNVAGARSASAARWYNFPNNRVFGLDVSSHQGWNVPWRYWWGQGKRFAFVKGTEGMTYKSPTYMRQINGAAETGYIVGAYHFARPSSSSGTAQAGAFVSYTGRHPTGGKMMPGVLDIEYNPGQGNMCYNMSQAAMRSWINSFLYTYRKLTGRNAIIYTTTHWWSTCTGNTSMFSGTNPLWIARYSSNAGTLPSGWGWYTFWQYSDSPIDQNVFNAPYNRLQVMTRY